MGGKTQNAVRLSSINSGSVKTKYDNESLWLSPSSCRHFLFFALQVLTICSQLMDEVMPQDRACRDFRSKFPDDVLQENLAGQLWFGAEVG